MTPLLLPSFFWYAQLLQKHVHQRDDPVALAVLLLVRSPRLRRWRRSTVVVRMGTNLGEDRLRGAGNVLRRRRGDHVRPARGRIDLLLFRPILRRRLLVHSRTVE